MKGEKGKAKMEATHKRQQMVLNNVFCLYKKKKTG